MTPTPEAPLDLSASRGMARWLASNRLSFAFSSYQSGQLFLVGSQADGKVSVNQQFFQRAMGLAYRPGRLYLASQFQLWRLENILRPGETANQHFDALFVARNAQTLGDIDVHELAIDDAGRPLFVNTGYSCLATADIRHSFRPIWKPDFISRLANEDRCHLNGLATNARGEPRYVTAASRSDMLNGWRDHRADGGVIIDVADQRIVAEGLSMPHSPRLHGEALYVLDSGRGFLCRVDIASGERTDIAFCPGFLRGMTIHNGHALVTVSKPREKGFAGLEIESQLASRNSPPWCGVLVINLGTGDIVEWMKFHSGIDELFDIVALPGIRCPMALGPAGAEIQHSISFDPAVVPLPPLAA